MDVVNILIVDDHTLFRTGIRKMLEAEADMRVVGEAATGREALEQARKLVPDVILMDIKMPDPSAPLRTGPSAPLRPGPSAPLRPGPSTSLRPGPSTSLRTGPSAPLRTSPSAPLRTSPSAGRHGEPVEPSGQALDGIEATRILHREMPHVGILFCTMFEDDEFVFAGLEAGGRGYILKDADPDTMLRAIRAVAHGESLLGPTVAQKVMRQFSALPGEQTPLFDDLTPRELQVLKLIAGGLSNKEIAQELTITEKTVKNHINNIFSKLHVNDRSQAVLYAIRKGLVKV